MRSLCFTRKRLSVLAALDEEAVLVTKGAFVQVLGICDTVELSDGRILAIAEYENAIQKRYEMFSERGLRTLGVAMKLMSVALPFSERMRWL